MLGTKAFSKATFVLLEDIKEKNRDLIMYNLFKQFWKDPDGCIVALQANIFILKNLNCEKFNTSLKLQLRNLVKTSIFSLIIVKRISDFWQAVFSLRFHSIFSISFSITNLNEKVTEEAYLFPILITLQWFSYFAIACIIEHAETSVPEWSKFWFYLIKKVLQYSKIFYYYSHFTYQVSCNTLF